MHQLVPHARGGRLHRRRLRRPAVHHVLGESRRRRRRGGDDAEGRDVPLRRRRHRDRPVPSVRRGDRRVPAHAGRRRATRRGDALLVGHDRTPEGHPAPPPRRPSERAAARDAVPRAQPVPHARGDDLPLAGADLPLGPAGVGGVRAAARVDVGDHGALRPRAVPRPDRAAPDHPLAGRADDVQPHAQAARRRP